MRFLVRPTYRGGEISTDEEISSLYYTQDEVDFLFVDFASQYYTETEADARFGRLASANSWTQQNTFVPTLDVGHYALSVAGASGAARDIFLAGQIGYSNGFTVQYTGTAMRYAFLNGDVGIGTASPGAQFVVSNSGAKGIEFTADYYGESYIQAYDRNASAYSPLSLQGSYLRLIAGGAEVARVASSGYVGIGTASPEHPLHVYGAPANYVARFRNVYGADAGHGVWIDTRWNTSGNYPLRVTSNQGTAELLAVRGDGNVGIGTLTPKKRLHVVSDSYLYGHIWMHAFEGDGNSGTAYLQARDDSGTSSIGLDIRTQNAGAVIDAMYVAANGYVGIGLSGGAASRLQVHDGDIRVSHGIPGSNAAPTGNHLMWTDYDGTLSGRVRMTDQLYDSYRSSMVFETRNQDSGRAMAERMRLNSTGLGIGTTTPYVPLEVYNPTRAALRLAYADMHGWDLSNSSSDAAFRLEYITPNGVYATALAATYDGRVGIAGAFPATGYSLTVAGSIYMTGPQIYRGGGNLTMYVDGGNSFLFRDSSDGNNIKVGIGTGSAQGQVHAHDGTGGMLFVSKTGIGAMPVTLIANGTGDVASLYATGLVHVKSSTGAAKTAVLAVDSSGNQIVFTGGTSDGVYFTVNADGSLTVTRIGSTLPTYSVVGFILWQ